MNETNLPVRVLNEKYGELTELQKEKLREVVLSSPNGDRRIARFLGEHDFLTIDDAIYGIELVEKQGTKLHILDRFLNQGYKLDEFSILLDIQRTLQGEFELYFSTSLAFEDFHGSYRPNLSDILSLDNVAFLDEITGSTRQYNVISNACYEILDSLRIHLDNEEDRVGFGELVHNMRETYALCKERGDYITLNRAIILSLNDLNGVV